MIIKIASKKPPQHAVTAAPGLRLATVKEACAYGKFSHTKLYDFINDGRVVAYKRDGRTLIDLDSIDAMNAGLPRIAPKGGPG